MAFYQNRMNQMQEEMERFEQEIAGQLARPPMPRMPGPNMSLRFIPHQLRPVAYVPPPTLRAPTAPLAQGVTTAGVAAAALAATMAPRFHPIPAAGQQSHQPTSAVIEGAPTRYAASATSTAGKSAGARQVVPPVNAANNPPPAVVPKQESPTKSSESKASSSNNAMAYTAYTVAGGSTKPSTSGTQQPQKYKKYTRLGGGQVWQDPSLNDWDPNDYRIFCGDLGNEVSDELLSKAFRKYPSFQKAKVVREKRTNKTKGYGFVSFKDPDDFTRALREMDGKYVGNRPIKLRKSSWRDRNMEVVKKKVKTKQKLGLKL